jgi:hypothetical protein
VSTAARATLGLSDEQLQDLVGAMVSGGTETGISVTYDDTNARLDFVVDDTTKVSKSLYDAHTILAATTDVCVIEQCAGECGQVSK